MTHTLARSVLFTIAVLLVGVRGAQAQVKEPPRTDKVKVEIRYRIRADRDERARQYIDLHKDLAKLGFVDARKNDPDYDLEILDPTAERITGTIPGAKVLQIFDNVRVQSILFEPDGFARPEPDQPVSVKIRLRGGYPPAAQRQLHRQTAAHLAQLGFNEALGYDTLANTLVRGSIPSKNLDVLVKDVRTEPSGWFVPATRLEQLPTPLRDRNPILWTEVLPSDPPPPPFNAPAVLPAQLKFSPDLRAALLTLPKGAELRVEVIFQDRIENLGALKTLIHGQYTDTSIDGIIGNVVHLRLARPEFVERLAQEPGVLGVRLPRQATETVAIGTGGKGTSVADALKASRLDELHKLGYTGAGMKVALIGSDFTGAEKLIGTELPKRTKIVDLTTELSPELVPFKADPTRLGTGLAAAKALAAAAPDADLVLVRIDPGCYFHLNTVLQLARGEIQYTDALQVRLSELATRIAVFEEQREAAIAAYKAAFADLTDTEGAVAKRKKAKADLDAILVKERSFAALSARMTAYQKEITSALRDTRAIVNTLVWESGYPLDSLDTFTATIDQLANARAPRVVKGVPTAPAPLVWVQAASASGPAVWGGAFLDSDRDGVMEFAPPKAKLSADAWTSTLNFLGTRTLSGDVTPDVAAGTKLRIVAQWREPADPNFPETDLPAQPLTLRLLRQIDPTGARRSSDQMAENARSVSVPLVIARTRTYLVFEQMLEYTVPAAGRYALAVESLGAADALLPALRRDVEIYPRIVIETVGTAPSDPKAVFRTFTSPTAGVGTPGDALGAVAVGTDAPGSLVGGGTGLTLRKKPDVLGPRALSFGAQIASGPGVATGFAGGAGVLLLQAHAAGPNVFSSAGIESGQKLELPPAWLKIVPPAPRKP